MKLQTKVEIPPFKRRIKFSDKLFFIGSCFTENVGSRFKNLFFHTTINPFGVTYNPMSISETLKIIANKRFFYDKDVFLHNGLYKSFWHHSTFSSSRPNELLDNINTSIEQGSEFLNSADFLIITFGTAYVYYKDGKIVNNCHKLPESLFVRRLLNVQQIVDEYIFLFDFLKKINPNLHIILTVSPVRHLRDGAIGNQVSKSTLLLAVYELVQKFEFVEYFPSYEIVIDELRDYRFYDKDLVHISDFAIDYIWEIIEENLIENAVIQDLSVAKKLSSALEHRFINTSEEELSKFIDFLEKNYKFLLEKYPNIDLKPVKARINELKLLVK